jgi:Fe-S cluster assembly iron-binding protein IscA
VPPTSSVLFDEHRITKCPTPPKIRSSSATMSLPQLPPPAQRIQSVSPTRSDSESQRKKVGTHLTQDDKLVLINLQVDYQAEHIHSKKKLNSGRTKSKKRTRESSDESPSPPGRKWTKITTLFGAGASKNNFRATSLISTSHARATATKGNQPLQTAHKCCSGKEDFYTYKSATQQLRPLLHPDLWPSTLHEVN